jgi:hypothetical protein
MKLAERLLAFIASGGAFDMRHDGTQVTVRAPGDRERTFYKDPAKSREAFIAEALARVEKRSAA